ncbi:MAG: hypothetical protein ACI4J6_11670 [Oscillospiraceae bacterium]
MSVSKYIEIDGKEVLFRASAAIPRMYRVRFHRDIYRDLRNLEKAIKNGNEDNSDIDLLSLEIFENIAYIMAKHADPTLPDTVEEWLDGFNTFSIYRILPSLIELWGFNIQTEIQSKKNLEKLNVK